MVCFVTDLIREITLPIGLDFMWVSYHGLSGGGVRVAKIWT